MKSRRNDSGVTFNQNYFCCMGWSRHYLSWCCQCCETDTLLGWYRRLMARKFDGSKSHQYSGRPRIDDEMEQWLVRMAEQNSYWGYDREAA